MSGFSVLLKLIHCAADAALESGLQPGVGLSMQEQFADFGVRLRRIDATVGNSEIRLRNRRLPAGNIPEPLQKTVDLP